VLVPQPQADPVHASPAAQVCPHFPQLVASVMMSMQVPPQHAWAAVHPGPLPHLQAEPAHVSPAPQACPQAPQSVAVSVVSTQLPSQHPWLPGQAAPVPQTHVEASHSSPAAQTRLHAPQCFASSMVLTHSPLQTVIPVPVHPPAPVDELVVVMAVEAAVPPPAPGASV
jgi:hypothetical protein